MTEISIRGEPQADPNVCRFVADREIYEGGSYSCMKREAAKGSPLLEALFAIPGITQTWISGRIVTVQKDSTNPWPVLGKQVGAAIRAHFAAGTPFVAPQAQAHSAEQDQLLATRVREILDAQVNPGVAGHGGKIELVDLRAGTAYLRMSGGCQGCGAAQMTLRQGVEKTLRAQLPEIVAVVDVTDHAAGAKPYY